MEQIAIVVRLKPGAEPRAAELIANGPPFDPGELGITRHSVYLAADAVVFVFEGHEVESAVDDLVEDPFRWMVNQAFDAWRPLVEGDPGSRALLMCGSHQASSSSGRLGL